MSTNTTGRENGHDTDALDARTQRALTEKLTVLTPDGFPVADADRTRVSVVSQSGETYTVDLAAGECDCPDATYNLADGEACKHERRAAIALGRVAVPAGVATAIDADGDLGEHVDTSLRFAAVDGGEIIDAGDDAELVDDDTDDERPADCSCDALAGDDLPCWACWSAGFRETPPGE
jgi:SWIM zinc finger.